MNPFALDGSAFLRLFGALFLIAGAASLLIPRLLRAPGRQGPLPEPAAAALAVLGGGATRLAEAAAAALLGRGALAIAGKRLVPAAASASPHDAAEAALAGGADNWRQAVRLVQPAAAATRGQLVTAGLIASPGDVRALRLAQTLPWLLLLIFGLARLAQGLERGRPVGFLILALLLAGVLALWRAGMVDRLTTAGHDTLARHRRQADRLRRATTADEAGLAVALFGTAVIATSPWGGLHRLRSSDGGDIGVSADSGGDGGGDGGGGGCGGGCGGCGG